MSVLKITLDRLLSFISPAAKKILWGIIALIKNNITVVHKKYEKYDHSVGSKT